LWLTFLIILIVISAALAISGEYRGPKRLTYIFKPLTLVLIILLAAIPKYPVTHLYRYLIIGGLVCSLVGDTFLLKKSRFVQGLLSFLIAHILYIAAFVNASGGRFSSWAAWLFVIHGGAMLRVLWPSLGKLKIPVVVYMLALLFMAVAAASWSLQSGNGAYLVGIGGILFVISDSILAVDKFKQSFRSAQLLILVTYFAAQLLIALST
jgi:uncharacterized membrane protein YhhN